MANDSATSYDRFGEIKYESIMGQYRGAAWGLLCLKVLGLPLILLIEPSQAQSNDCHSLRQPTATTLPAGLSGPPTPQPATVNIGPGVSIGPGVLVEGQVVTKKPGLTLQGSGSSVVPIPSGVMISPTAAVNSETCKPEAVPEPPGSAAPASSLDRRFANMRSHQPYHWALQSNPKF